MHPSFDEDSKTLGIVGTGSGAGVQITSGNGEIVTINTTTPFQQIQDGSNTLQFSAYLR